MSSTGSSRTYNGLTPDARRAQRRALWMSAGLDLFGTLGYRRTTLRALSERSGVAARYFSESFTSLDDLFLAIYDRLHADMANSVARAVGDSVPEPSARIRVGATALFHELTGDPRVSRIKLVEALSVGDAVASRQRDSLREIAAIIEFCLPPALPHIDMVVITRALAGALIEVIVAHNGGDLTETTDDLVEHMVLLCEGVMSACCKPS